MTNTDQLQAALDWVEAVIPAINGSTYDYAPAGKAKALPDCVGSLEAERVVLDDSRFPIFQLQQLACRVFELELSIMVDNGEDEVAGAAAAQTLRDYAEALTTRLLMDPTLGGTVDAASPLVEFDYTRPFVEYPDGTRGREVRMRLALAEAVVAAD